MMLLLILLRLLIHQRRLIIGESAFRSGRTHPHEQLSAGQVVVVIGENVRQLLERLHAVSAAKGTTTLNTAHQLMLVYTSTLSILSTRLPDILQTWTNDV